MKALLALSLMALLLLTACDLLPGPPSPGVKITVEDITLSSGDSGRIGIIVETPGSPGLTELQVGPTAVLSFDPHLIQLEGIEGVNGFTVLASDIDNTKGEARFAAASLLGDGVQGRILELVVRAIGEPGREAKIVLTGADWVLDPEGNSLPLISVKAGKVRIE